MMLVNWFSTTSRLASLSRFSMERLQCRESVLEHIGQVTLTATMLACEVNSRDPSLRLSLESVTVKALVHDLEEVITGDVARPTKHATDESREMFAAMARRAVSSLSIDLAESDLGSFARVVRWHHAQAKTGLCGMIVALADILAVCCKVWEEVILCNQGSMIRQSHTAMRQLHAFRQRLDEEINRDSPAHEFLMRVVDQAQRLMHEAASRDSEWLATKIEIY